MRGRPGRSETGSGGSYAPELVERRGVASACDGGGARWRVVGCGARAGCPGCVNRSGIACGYSDVHDAGESTFVVPAGDSYISVTATGAQGAAGFDSCGGFGAVVTTNLPVTGGETLYVEVGGVGSNGGGAGGSGAGDGGGASDLRTLPVADGLTPADSRLVVAAGGGGGGDGIELGMTGCGGNAGSMPAGGQGAFGIGGGGPGGSTSGGTPGNSDADCSPAQAGALGVGGAGGGTLCGGGGGGGAGFYGGGGGGAADATSGAGGGAGSSFVGDSATGTSITTAS